MPAVFPMAAEQRCWNHRLLNLLDKVPTRLQAEAKSLLTKIPYAETREAAERQKLAFQTWATKKGVAAVGPIESPFAAVRLRTTAAKRFKRVENATAVIWKTLLIAERTFRRLDAPELLAEVAEGATYVNGVRVKPSPPTAEEKAAA